MHLVANYLNSPDVLDLVINPSELGGIVISHLHTPFGIDERKVATYHGVLIGVLVEASQYYEGLKVNLKDRVVISLLPAAKYLNGIELPELDTFLNAMQEIISIRNSAWLLVCERDCDQEPVIRLDSENDRANIELKALVAFCQNGGICPTFMIENER